MDAALDGEGPPPHCLRKFMLAAGVGEVGGLGASVIYGDRQLTLREFEEAWMCQQAILRHQNQEAQDKYTQERSIEKAVELEKSGFLDAVEADPSLAVPDWIPRDPGF